MHAIGEKKLQKSVQNMDQIQKTHQGQKVRKKAETRNTKRKNYQELGQRES